MSLKNRSLVSINDYTKSEWLHILKVAKKFESKPPKNLLSGKVIASLFFEPSTRTRLSFESAVLKLGGSIISFADAKTTSTKKGETLKDTARIVSKYADLLVMRHPVEGSARLASEYIESPVVNAGDGANEHPTQTLLDLYSIQKTQGKLDNLTVSFVGDLKYGRTTRSLMLALSEFKNIKFILVSPPELKITSDLRYELEQNNADFEEIRSLNEAIEKSDIIYMTRIQQERFSDPLDYERVKDSYVLHASMLDRAKPNAKVMHPLPRVHEINEDVDDTKHAYYFEQAANGIPVRQAIIAVILGAVK